MRQSLSLLAIATLFIVLTETGMSQQPAPPATPVQGGSVQIELRGGSAVPAQGTFQLAPGQGGVQFQSRGAGQGGPGGGGPGGGGGGPGRTMGMMGGGDPMTFFNMLSRGKDTINRNDLEEWQQRMFDRMAPAMGITNGQMSRDQFRQAAEQMRSRMQNGGGQGGPGGPGGGNFGAGMSPEQMDRFSSERFRRSDVNGDGLLQVNEQSERLRPVWEKFDLNKDGAIDLNEYKSYTRIAFQQEQANAPQAGQPATGQPMQITPDAGQPVIIPEDDERKPTVYRAGKLPKDIPQWFEQLDLDKDGQIGLYEWVRGGKTIDEYRPMDRNDDGFLTIDEIMTFVHHGEKQPGSQSNAIALGGGGSSAPGGFNAFGGGGNTRMFNAGGGNNDDSRGRGRGPGAWSGEGNGRRRGGDGNNNNTGFNRGPRGGDGNNNNTGFNRGPRGGDGNINNNNGNFNRGPRGDGNGGNGAGGNGFNRGPRGDGNNSPASGNGRNPRGNSRYDPYSDPTLP